MNNVITLQQAIDMTTRFREQNESGGKIDIPQCETFDRAIFDQILAETGCVKMRIYSGLTTAMGYRSIIVGVNDQNEDILPEAAPLGDGTLDDDGTGSIAEDGLVCPPYCPPQSPLNP